MKKRSGSEFNSNNLDIFLAIIATSLMPLICGKLFEITGAFLPLLIYYGIFCIALVKWRKGSLDYRRPCNIPTPFFIGLILLQLLIVFCSNRIIIPAKDFSLNGFLLTLLIWAPINAFAEQLLWIYIYDAFANRFHKRRLKIIFSGIGIIFYWGIIGMIHIFFWSKFLMEFHHTAPYWQLFMLLNYPLTLGYIIIYKKTKSMYPIAFIHLMVDLAGVWGSGYNIIPYLFK